ncbi:hypothetical protein [Deminuibacter soli]|uniref:hypothetical protein n=1 Tax=Deminuibacter soli TaxID=2291815 RepID=UPI001314A9E7|nr:hypothetical protein [Deminuibacter soli]
MMGLDSTARQQDFLKKSQAATAGGAPGCEEELPLPNGQTANSGKEAWNKVKI